MKIIQFGYKLEVPKGIPLVDCRILPNPFRVQDDQQKRILVTNNRWFKTLVAEGVGLLKNYDTIGVGCAYGVHRSGMVVEAITAEVCGVEVQRIGQSLRRYHGRVINSC